MNRGIKSQITGMTTYDFVKTSQTPPPNPPERNDWLFDILGMPAETATAMCSMIFGGVLEKVPNLKVCFAHGGR